jgi:tRNA(Ile)-lysidine synthase
MLHQLFHIDRSTPFILACSGGVDSMAIADFYKRGNKNFTIAYFNHGTPQAEMMEDFTRSWASKNGVDYVTGKITRERAKGESKEEFWRNERYSWLHEVAGKMPIVTCHHLGDAVEGYIFSALNGNPKVISSVNGNVVRPFLLNSKEELISWCIRHKVKWLEDESNKDVNFPRNRIRHNIVPEALLVNPGLAKVVKKKIIQASK